MNIQGWPESLYRAAGPLASFGLIFFASPLVMGGLAAVVNVRIQEREADDEARRDERVRLPQCIDAEYALHSYSALSRQLVAAAMTDGVPA